MEAIEHRLVPLKMKVLRSTGEGSPETLRFQDPNVENEKSTSTGRIFTVIRIKTIFEFGYVLILQWTKARAWMFGSKGEWRI